MPTHDNKLAPSKLTSTRKLKQKLGEIEVETDNEKFDVLLEEELTKFRAENPLVADGAPEAQNDGDAPEFDLSPDGAEEAADDHGLEEAV